MIQRIRMWIRRRTVCRWEWCCGTCESDSAGMWFQCSTCGQKSYYTPWLKSRIPGLRSEER